LQIKRESFYPKEEILDDIVYACHNSNPDCITFVGDGEPTLFHYLGWLIRNVTQRVKVPIAVITNGSLLYRKDVQQDLELADIVMASVDAGDERHFHMINRPHSGIDYHTVIDGICDFSSVYRGSLWIEVMLVKGLNDSEEELIKINKIIKKISPSRVYLLMPIRPPAEKWVSVPDPANIMLARELINKSIPIVEYESNDLGLQNYHNAEQAILNIGKYHPLRKEQIEKIIDHFGDHAIMNQLLEIGRLKLINYDGTDFFIPNELFGKMKSQQ
ncbi:MAG: hypothetical protein ABIJ45_03380, partial [Candidatus Zixiibacteriota bacterium]